MAKIENSTLKAQCKRLTEKKQWEVESWTSTDSAIAAIRTVLEDMGCMEELGDEYKEERAKLASALAPLFTAPINWQRTYLVDEELAPKQAEKPKAKASDMA